MKHTVRFLRWLRRPLGIFFIAVVILAGVVVFAQIANRNSKTDVLQINGRSFSLEIANTQAERALGLGRRPSLPTDRGMLFIFGSVQPECFWMKDMHFPLDIIWVNNKKQVVHIAHSVSPSTYPDSFCPVEPVKYVIELNAGMADNTDMRVGETLDF